MPIRTQLLKKWVGPGPEKHIGSTPLILMLRHPCVVPLSSPLGYCTAACALLLFLVIFNKSSQTIYLNIYRTDLRRNFCSFVEIRP